MSDAPDGNQKSTDKPAPGGIVPTECAEPKPPEQPTSTHKRKHTWLEIFAVTFAAAAFLAAGYQGFVARDTEKRQLRAYVGIEQVYLTCAACDDPSKKSAGKTFADDNSFIIEYKNIGATPAANIKGFANWREGPFGKELPPNFDYSDGTANTDTLPLASLDTNPGQTSHGGNILDAGTINLIQRARRNEVTAFFYGHLNYKDAFACENVLNFCFSYAPDAKERHQFPNCPNHNGSEQKCTYVISVVLP